MSDGSAAARPPANPWVRWSWLMPSVFLVFLVFPIIETVQTIAPVWAKALTLGLLALFAGVYVLAFSRWGDHPWRSGLLLGAAALGTAPVLGVEAVGLTPFLGAFSALQVPRPWWPWTTVATAALPLFSLLGDESFPLFFFLLVWPIIVVCVLVRLLDESEREHRASAELHALTSERERVARDVHDVLGHSLTALSIKAELAARLIDADPERARDELLSIQETARQALAEVRSTVVGLRASNLEAELSAAPQVLADADVRTTIEGEVSDTDPRHRALLAWVLREAVTNVVRHAGATHVTVTLGPRGVVVADDGRGFTGPEGNGLRGMRERVSAAGGRLETSGDHPGARLEVLLP